MFSWLIPSAPFTHKFLKIDIGVDVFSYFINETRQYGKIFFVKYLFTFS